MLLAEVIQDYVALFSRKWVGLRCLKALPPKVDEVIGQSKIRHFRPRIAHHGTEGPVDDVPA
ncbi:MAG: hypothetical protein A3F90_01210 [Deltaproteobacteria bacterium RIFCSPLOWO2_12_FULL_60_19]|nr:MAG: hypothetical protein A3F90_01210 [Deltaproteobacteria bacterium RIFCSPLOWO2_12_FULL_60_19]